MRESKVEKTCHLIVSGRVQGVGFRQFMAVTAKSLGITGWVRNRTDGSVEAVISGPSDAVASMIERARRGPHHAAVRDLKIAEVQGTFENFEVLSTL